MNPNVTSVYNVMFIFECDPTHILNEIKTNETWHGTLYYITVPLPENGTERLIPRVGAYAFRLDDPAQALWFIRSYRGQKGLGTAYGRSP
jgi:hypothetical protein